MTNNRAGLHQVPLCRINSFRVDGGCGRVGQPMWQPMWPAQTVVWVCVVLCSLLPHPCFTSKSWPLVCQFLECVTTYLQQLLWACLYYKTRTVTDPAQQTSLCISTRPLPVISLQRPTAPSFSSGTTFATFAVPEASVRMGTFLSLHNKPKAWQSLSSHNHQSLLELFYFSYQNQHFL